MTRPTSILEILHPDGSTGYAVLNRTPFSIGAAADADLRLAGSGLGPHQARIVRLGGRYHLVRERPDGRVAVDGRPAAEGVAPLTDGSLITFGPGCAVRLRFRQGGALAPAGQDRLVALMDIARTITASIDLNEVLARVLEGAVRFSGAERGFLFLKGPEGLIPWTPDGIVPPNLEVSRTVAEEVARTGRPLDRDRIGDEGGGSATASIVRLRLRAILCLPLSCRGETIGVVYLDSRRALPHHRPELPLLEALAGLAAVAIQNGRLVAERLRAERTLAFAQMARGIVHDLRTPLASIRGLAELLLERAAPTDASRPHLRTIIGEVDRLTGLTGDLLQMSRDAPPLRRETLSIDDLVRRTLASLDVRLRQRGVTVELDLDPAARISADAPRLVRVLHNLVANALDAMSAGGTLSITGRPIPPIVRLIVRDTGGGMPEEVRARVFEPFFTHGKRGGTGLGMAIARTIIEEHGGTIRLESSPGCGTTVTIDLPTGPAAPREANATGSTQAEANGSTAN